MIKWPIDTVHRLRLETMEDVEEFHKYIQKEADEIGCNLKTFQWNEKEIKSTEEVFYVVKYALVFNNMKSPRVALGSIEYELFNPSTGEVC